MLEESVLIDDLCYPEGPRWHDGHLYVADFYAHQIVRSDLHGNKQTVLNVPGQPSGMGWLPDGRLILTSMRDARVLTYDGRRVSEIAGLSGVSPCLNELVVDQLGRAYVGGMPDVYQGSFDPEGASGRGKTQFALESLYLVEDQGPDRPANYRIVAEDINFPNGSAITPDGRTLILAETLSNRLLAFDILDDGSLVRRRVWAPLPGLPDGLCFDAEGCVWVAIPLPEEARGFHRVAEGGAVIDTIASDRYPMAVMLGGTTGHHIFLVETLVVGVGPDPAMRARGNGRVRVGRVDVPKAGLP